MTMGMKPCEPCSKGGVEVKHGDKLPPCGKGK